MYTLTETFTCIVFSVTHDSFYLGGDTLFEDDNHVEEGTPFLGRVASKVVDVLMSWNS